jgi:hypothetical protein
LSNNSLSELITLQLRKPPECPANDVASGEQTKGRADAVTIGRSVSQAKRRPAVERGPYFSTITTAEPS